MTNIIFSEYPYWLTEDSWYEVIPPKGKNDQQKSIRLSSPILIKSKFLDPNSGVEKLVISNGQNIERIETSDILTSQKLPSLIMYGFSINEKYIKSLSNALQLMRQSLPLSSLYTGVGVLNTNKGVVISLDEPYLSKEITQSQADEIICETQYDLQPKGTFEDWWQMYLDEVKGNLLLELAVVFAISSLLTAFLKSKNEVEFAGTIFSFMGNSSTGKSTAAALAVSLAGNPTKGTNTLFRSWNGTRNALEGYLSNNYGVPIVLDELSAATFRNTTGLLYSIAEGQGRQRSRIDGSVKDLKNWGTSVISTAEHSIFNNSARNDGLNVRTIEISEAFTTNADNADAIKKSVSGNYGHILPLVAEYLFRREDEVIKWFNTEHKWFNTQLEKETSNTGIRMFKRYATITTSARILERVIATPVDLNAVRDFLINYHLDSVSERSLADKAIEVIVQFVAQNRGKFSDDTRLSTLIENYGMISLEDDHIQVKMIASVFKNMLKEHNFQDTNNVIDALRDKDYIQSDANRKTTKRSVKDKEGKPKTIVFYHLKLDKSYAPIFGLSEKSEFNIPLSFNSEHQHPILRDMISKAREWDKNGDIDF
ncbi:cassette chromosome replicative helicase [Staphylococcus pseudoxylosus]|uniref:cassette chromosome replicative helicase n=1 Tax=Staphylococcus pseudoxylosus TaxID=2282419 RepID=UPI0030158E65